MKIIDANPTDPRVIAMVAELDQMMMALYPAESNYLTEPISLTNGANKFFGVEIEGELLGIGALMEFGRRVEFYVLHEFLPQLRQVGLATDQLEVVDVNR